MTISDSKSSRFKQMLASIAAMAGLLLLDGQLGPLSFLLRRTAAAALIGVLVAFARPKGCASRVFMACAAAFVAAFAPTTSLALLAYSYALAMLAAPRSSNQELLARCLPEACLTYVGIGFVGQLLPPLRVLNEGLSGAAQAYLSATHGAGQHLSPTALGAWAVALAALYLIWQWRFYGSWVRLVAVVLIWAGWFLTLPLVVLAASAGPNAIFLRGAAHGLFCIACAVVIDTTARRNADRAPWAMRRMPRPLALSSALACILIGMTLVGIVAPRARTERSILVHNRGGLDWDRPVFGKFGAFSGGMFGLFPVYARGNGYRFEVLDQDIVTADDLSGFQTLVLINSPKHWDGEELQAVRDFVAGGGNLLVLGDHTDVFGLMNGLNSLLAGFGIQFRFDSAYFARSTWRGCISVAPDAVACDWENEGPGVAIGASLELTGWSRPLVCGRFAHSDIGSRANIVGSFLGNYRYDQEERLGDTVLMASAIYGRGRVIVLGDTSPFQGGLSYSFPRTVGPLLNLLSRPVAFVELRQFRATSAALLIAILFSLGANGAGARLTAAITLSLFVGMAASLIVSRAQLSSPIAIDRNCFLIDKSHLPAIGHYVAKVNPSTLETNLYRCGLRVADLDEWDDETLSKARGIAFIAPQRSFTPGEIEAILRFEQAGGVVILAAGRPDSSASLPLLLAHGLDLEARPLGTLPNHAAAPAETRRSNQERPRFLDAWPIVSVSGRDLSTNAVIEVIYRTGNDVTALFCRHGRGGLMFFSDTRFFSSMNIEDVAGYWIGNLALIHDAFRKYLVVEPGDVRPLFRSPKKPE